MLLVGRKKPTNHPKLLAVYRAQVINLQCNGTVIAPWEVDQLDEEWLAVFTALADTDRWSRNSQQFENRLQERRREHPTYRKYIH
jgi:hypothetical protein